MKIKEQQHGQTADEISPSQPEKGQAPCPDNQSKTADSTMYFAIGVSEDLDFIPSAEPAAETSDGFLLNRLCEQAEQNRQANVKFGAGIDTAEKQTVPAYGGALDIARLAAAFLVVAIHTSVLSTYNETADFLLTRVAARVAVPLFLMISGAFVLNGRKLTFKHFIIKNALLYFTACALYLPVGLYAGLYHGISLVKAVQLILWEGPFYHLWYLPAAIAGGAIVYWLRRHFSIKTVLAITAGLYIIGLFGDSYYGLIADTPVGYYIYQPLFAVFSKTRNGLFLAPLFMAAGCVFSRMKREPRRGLCLTLLIISSLSMAAEALTLRALQWQRHDSMYFCLIPTMLFLFTLLYYIPAKPRPFCRRLSTWVYLLHPLAILFVRGGAKLLSCQPLLVQNSLVHYLSVCLCAAGAALTVGYVQLRLARGQKSKTGRAYIELSRAALLNNVHTLRSLMPEGCELMPVVKANAYGHGAELIAMELQKAGIHILCVATAAEGAALRRKGIEIDILVLGYTHPEDFTLLRRYKLIQTVIDVPYARQLQQDGHSYRVHLGIDTGLHRLGVRAEEITQIEEIFQIKNLKIEGIYTHFASAENTPDGIMTTSDQASRFYALLAQLHKHGISVPKYHLQASYGLINCPEYTGSYARAGIALYGMLSSRQDTERCALPLYPVLSLKARVACVKSLYKGEKAGYGSAFIAKQDMKIAVISIGYADGLPRALSGKGRVLIAGHEAPIIGRICMDLTLVNVTNLPDIKAGDTAVMIGRSGELEITACELAEKADTIANEVLSRLSCRLERFMS